MMKRMFSILLVLTLVISASPAMADTYRSQHYANEVDAVTPRNIQIPVPGEDGNYPLNPVIEGESSTTGLPKDTDEYLPILVNVDNYNMARDQWGIKYADIIYEMPIHAQYETRLVCLFTHNHPTEVGPVRSARILHLDLRDEWDSAWVFYGVQPYEGSNVNVEISKRGMPRREGTILFDGTNGAKKWTPAFKDTNYHVSPHDHGVDLTKIAELVVESGHEFHERPFLFTDEKPTLGVDATKVAVIANKGEGSYSSDAYYEYDAETNKYMRTTATGKYVDYLDPEVQLGFENVIIQRTVLQFYSGAANRPKLPNVVGEGHADIFMGGKYIAGYWVRTALDQRTIFFDSEGNELELQRGHTWITVTTDQTRVTYE